MATVLGELTDHLKKSDLSFTVLGVECVVDADADTVLRFLSEYRAALLEGTLSGEVMYKMACELAGGSFDDEEYHCEGSFFPKLYAAGVDWRQLDRILVTITTFYYYGGEVAAEYFQTGELGKAIRAKIKTDEEPTEASDETA